MKKTLLTLLLIPALTQASGYYYDKPSYRSQDFGGNGYYRQYDGRLGRQRFEGSTLGWDTDPIQIHSGSWGGRNYNCTTFNYGGVSDTSCQ